MAASLVKGNDLVVRPSPDRLAFAIAHPIRFSILRIMGADEGRRPWSPRTLQPKLRKPLNVVAYHVRKLDDEKVILSVEDKPVRGVVEHFYRFNISETWVLMALGLEVTVDTAPPDASEQEGDGSDDG